MVRKRRRRRRRSIMISNRYDIFIIFHVERIIYSIINSIVISV